MCGICGFQGRFDEPLLQRMTARLRERGPDGGAVALRPDDDGATLTGFGHRRLSIIDLSTDGRQPMRSACPACGTDDPEDELLVCYNGELYDYVEPRARLQAAGHRFSSRTDTEVLLHRWATEGPAMLPTLNGIFAFAIRDGRRTGRPAGIERGDVILVRDPIGVKPLYIAELPEGVLFASELKALLEHPGLPLALDVRAASETLAHLWTPGPRTLFTAVRKVAPGEALVIRHGRVVKRWTYAAPLYDGTRHEGDPRAIVDGLDATLAGAVRRQMVADTPVGAFLSGGLDSSAVVAYMREAAPSTSIDSYCISFAGDEDVEGNPSDAPYARRVAAHLGVTLHELFVDETLIEDLPRLIWLLDEPQADPAPLNALRIAARARADGIPVLLSGAGGDDILSGYRRHQALAAASLLQRIPAALRAPVAAAARVAATRGMPAGGTQPLLRRLLKVAATLDTSGDRYLATQFWWSPDGLRQALFSPEARRTLAGHDVATPLLDALRAIPAEPDALNRLLFLETRFFLADHNLNYTDKTGMAHGIEVRVPLLDLEVVRYAARMPVNLKLDGTTTKASLRRLMEPRIPRDVIYRGKSGFAAPIRRWLRGPLRAFVDDALAPERVRRRGLFDPAAIAALRARDATGHVDGSLTVLALIVLESWCEQFVDGRRPPLRPETHPHV